MAAALLGTKIFTNYYGIVSDNLHRVMQLLLSDTKRGAPVAHLRINPVAGRTAGFRFIVQHVISFLIAGVCVKLGHSVVVQHDELAGDTSIMGRGQVGDALGEVAGTVDAVAGISRDS
jgi:hypothetical protein